MKREGVAKLRRELRIKRCIGAEIHSRDILEGIIDLDFLEKTMKIFSLFASHPPDKSS